MSSKHLLQAGALYAALTGLAAAATNGNAYLQHNLVSDTAGVADFTDPNLINPWGIATSSGSPFWVSDNATGLSTVYTSTGSVSSTKATVPPSAMGKSPSEPTGIVYNGTGGFAISGHAPSFIFCTADGAVSGWASAVSPTLATLKIDNSASGAIYYGMAISSGTTGPYIYLANFHSGAIEAYDTNYAPATLSGKFADPGIPAGYAPFNIWNLGGKLYVAYALQDPTKTYDQPGVGNGYVSVFDLNGNLLQHLVAGGPLNAPWGMAIASANFGAFANALLVGNFGDGHINAFNPTSGALLGTLQDVNGNTIQISGLWALIQGNGGNGGDANAIYFAAGIGGEQHGLLGSLQAAPVITSTQVVNAADGAGTIAPNMWVSIFGANLSPTTQSWTAAEIVNGALPVELNGVSVQVNGKSAAVAYISPKQINVLTTSDTATAAENVNVITGNNSLVSGVASVPLALESPACFFFGTGPNVAALHSDNVTPVGPTSLYPNLSYPAKPGEEIVIFGNGFGPVVPGVTAALPTVTIGGANAQVVFGGYTGPGLYQVNVVVPAGTPNGNAAVMIQLGSASTPSGGMIAVQQ